MQTASARVWLRVQWTVALLLLGLLWLEFAPPKWGGHTTFLVVHGISMLPKFHAGDLVAVRPAARYGVGTLAAYHYPALHTVFFHRIIATRGSRYVFQGLNNHYADPYHPTKPQIIGRLWFTLPHVGAWLAFWREPQNAALLVAAITVVSLLWSRDSKRRRNAMQRARITPAESRRADWWLSGLVDGLAVLAVAAAALALWVFLQPLAVTQSAPIPYTQQGHFSYQASVPKSVLYPSGVVSPGSPVDYPAASRLTATFDYHLRVPGGRSVGGTARLIATLVSTSGWRERLPGSGPLTFHGSTVALHQVISVAQVFSTIAHVNQLTNDTMDTYQLVLTASVHAVGMARGHSIFAAQSPTLAFLVQPSWLQLSVPTTTTLHQYLNPTAASSLGTTATVPNRLGLLGSQLRIATARLAAPLVLLILLALLALTLRRQRQHEQTLGEAARISQQYQSLLIGVDQLPFSPPQHSIRVGSMEGLVRLATQFERIILHAVDLDGQHLYLLENAGESYYFSVRGDDAAAPHRDGRAAAREAAVPH